MSYASEVLADSPIRYFRFNDTSVENIAIDETATANGLYLVQADYAQPSLIASDTSNYSVSFDGSNTGKMRAKESGRILGGLVNSTVECWLKTTDTTLAWFAYCERGATGNDVYRVQTSSAAKTAIRFTYRDDAGTLDIITGSTVSALSDGNPHHIVVTKTGTAIAFYVDGAAQGTGTLTATDTLTETSLDSNFGRDLADTAGGGLKNTFIDEGALYNTALSAARIAVHYAAAFESGTIGSFRTDRIRSRRTSW